MKDEEMKVLVEKESDIYKRLFTVSDRKGREGIKKNNHSFVCSEEAMASVQRLE
jgi:hypothetical protein